MEWWFLVLRGGRRVVFRSMIVGWEEMLISDMLIVGWAFSEYRVVVLWIEFQDCTSVLKIQDYGLTMEVVVRLQIL